MTGDFRIARRVYVTNKRKTEQQKKQTRKITLACLLFYQ
jgi:hypothetical protein